MIASACRRRVEAKPKRIVTSTLSRRCTRLAFGQWKSIPVSSTRSRRSGPAVRRTSALSRAIVSFALSGRSTSYIAGGSAVDSLGPFETARSITITVAASSVAASGRAFSAPSPSMPPSARARQAAAIPIAGKANGSAPFHQATPPHRPSSASTVAAKPARCQSFAAAGPQTAGDARDSRRERQQQAEHENSISRPTIEPRAGQPVKQQGEGWRISAKRIGKGHAKRSGEEPDAPAQQFALPEAERENGQQRQRADIDHAHIAGEIEIDRAPCRAGRPPMVLKRASGPIEIGDDAGQQRERMQRTAARPGQINLRLFDCPATSQVSSSGPAATSKPTAAPAESAQGSGRNHADVAANWPTNDDMGHHR